MRTISAVSSSIEKKPHGNSFVSKFFVLPYKIKIYIQHTLSDASPVSTKERVCQHTAMLDWKWVHLHWWSETVLLLTHTLA